MISLLILTLSSCSKEQIIRTELEEVKSVAFIPISPEFLKNCQKIEIKDKLTNNDIINLLLNAIIYLDTCTKQIEKIRIIYDNRNQMALIKKRTD